MKNIILLENCQFYAFHGCLPHEKTRGNQFLVTVKIEVKSSVACRTDHLVDALDYGKVYQTVKREMEKPANLLEHVAYRILSALKEEFSKEINSIEITVKKHNPPVDGDVEWSGVVLSEHWQ